MMGLFSTTILFLVTAITEILGCYLPYLWLRQGRSAWLLLPAALSLITFRLAIDVASNSLGQNLCSLRWHLCQHGHSLALARRRDPA
jgi:drug/metabolite transporter superfamily protein YnfA